MSSDPDRDRDVLRGASDGLVLAIREVEARERLKRGVRPSDPEFAPLAREVRIAAEAVLALAREEEERADDTSGNPLDASLPTINDSPPRPDLSGILADWRSVERQLAATDLSSSDANRLMEEFETLRDRYAQALRLLKHQR
jgi:hypothetical protein